MKSKFIRHSFCLALLFLQACDRNPVRPGGGSTESSHVTAATTPDPMRIVLAPIGGESALDQKISRAQSKVRAAADPSVSLEQLGWLFVAKARADFDPGYYKLAEQCALALDRSAGLRGRRGPPPAGPATAVTPSSPSSARSLRTRCARRASKRSCSVVTCCTVSIGSRKLKLS